MTLLMNNADVTPQRFSKKVREPVHQISTENHFFRATREDPSRNELPHNKREVAVHGIESGEINRLSSESSGQGQNYPDEGPDDDDGDTGCRKNSHQPRRRLVQSDISPPQAASSQCVPSKEQDDCCIAKR